MLRFVFLVVLNFIISLSLYSQKPIKYYKSAVDSFMAIHLDTSILNGMVCHSYMATLKNENEMKYAGPYEIDKDSVLANMGKIGFFYNYYSQKLNFSFHWYLSLNETGKVLPVSMISETFPECIQKGQPCYIISKDSAVKIAQRDSMKFSDNYYVDLSRPKKSNCFYWVITGVDKNIYDYSRPPQDDIDSTYSTLEKRAH